MEFPRERYIERLDGLRFKGGVKIITGMRRCGKSYLLFELYRRHLIDDGVPEDHIVAISLEPLENRRLRDPVALLHEIDSRIADDGRHYVMLDEIQMASGFVDPPEEESGHICDRVQFQVPVLRYGHGIQGQRHGDKGPSAVVLGMRPRPRRRRPHSLEKVSDVRRSPRRDGTG